MLLVSRCSQISDRESTALQRTLWDRVVGLHVDPRVATKFWHSACVYSQVEHLPPNRVVFIRLGCGAPRENFHGKFGSVTNGANFLAARALDW
jgi:hypothetical protein